MKLRPQTVAQDVAERYAGWVGMTPEALRDFLAGPEAERLLESRDRDLLLARLSGRTLRGIGAEQGISGTRVQQRERRALSRIRNRFYEQTKET